MEQQVCARCFWTMDKELNIDGMKLLNKKNTCPAVSSRLTDSGQLVIHSSDAVHVHLPTSTKLRISHSVKKINYGNSLQWEIVWQISIFLGSVITLINLCVLTFHQMSPFKLQ